MSLNKLLQFKLNACAYLHHSTQKATYPSFSLLVVHSYSPCGTYHAISVKPAELYGYTLMIETVRSGQILFISCCVVYVLVPTFILNDLSINYNVFTSWLR